MSSMGARKAVIRGGQVILEEPLDLPDGTVVSIDVDPYAHLKETDELDDEGRALLHAALDRSWAQIQKGELGRPIKDILQDL